MNDSGIYAIKNMANGKVYIGSACCFSSRFAMHRSALKRHCHHSIKLQRAWDKYGEPAFLFTPIVKCSQDNLLMYEQIVLDGFCSVDAGYNIANIAGSRIGVPASEETKAKISRALIGNSYRLGIPHSEESKRKMKESSKNKKPLSKESREKIGLKHRGKIVSEETKKKMSETRSGRIQKNSRSGAVGVYWNERKRLWKAVINTGESIMFVGYFKDVKSASDAILGAKNEMF